MTSSTGGRGAVHPIVVATILRRHGETGVQTHISAVLDALQGRGIPAVFINHLSSWPILGLPVLALRRVIDRLNGSLSVAWYVFWHYWLLRMALRRRLRRAGPVVIYAQCPISARAALASRRPRDQPVVMAVHFNHSQADEWVSKGRIPAGGWVYRRLVHIDRAALPALDEIVYLSRYMRDYLVARHSGLDAIRSIISPNFISPAPAGDGSRPAHDLITIGKLDTVKNQRYLLEVIARAADLGKRYSLTIVGEGPERASMEAEAGRLGISDLVRFLGYRPDARALLPAYRAYVHAATIDNAPMVILEALAAGVPVFAPAVGGIPELITDGVEGVIWPLADPAEGARRLTGILDDEPRRSRMGAAARQRFAAGFETSVVADRLIAFLVDAGTTPG